MKKLVILLMVGLMTKVAVAQEILLSCKWQSGEIMGERKIIKGEVSTNDVILGINIHQKKITRSVYGGEAINLTWSEDLISWNSEHKQLKFYATYWLSRISGSLELITKHTEPNTRIKMYYICDKTQKKF